MVHRGLAFDFRWLVGVTRTNFEAERESATFVESLWWAKKNKELTNVAKDIAINKPHQAIWLIES